MTRMDCPSEMVHLASGIGPSMNDIIKSAFRHKKKKLVSPALGAAAGCGKEGLCSPTQRYP